MLPFIHCLGKTVHHFELISADLYRGLYVMSRLGDALQPVGKETGAMNNDKVK
jgi:hypothetical protein